MLWAMLALLRPSRFSWSGNATDFEKRPFVVRGRSATPDCERGAAVTAAGFAFQLLSGKRWPEAALCNLALCGGRRPFLVWCGRAPSVALNQGQAI